MSQKPTNRPRLGRGLSSLIPTTEPTEALEQRAYFMCAIGALEAMPGQPRKHFEDAALEELAESIRNSGIIQPLVVRALEDGRYRLIAGERRFRAAQRAGLKEVPVVVRDVSDREAFTLALIENIQREDLNPIEEAEAYRHLTEDYGLTHEETAKRVGRSRAAVSNTLRLLGLPDEVRELLRSGQLTAGHSRAILSAKEEHRVWLAERIVENELSVRAAEVLARTTHQENFSTKPKKTEPADATHDESLYTPNVRDAERRIRERLGHQVKIRRQSDRTGVIELHFSDDDSLNDIITALLDEGL